MNATATRRIDIDVDIGGKPDSIFAGHATPPTRRARPQERDCGRGSSEVPVEQSTISGIPSLHHNHQQG